MTELVVHLLETIEVEQKNGTLLATATSLTKAVSGFR
jgi:hypothetical protein